MEKNNLDLPVPTQIVSNGEYLPPKQSNLQKKVEKRMVELADENAKYLGLSRRQFLQTSCGMATAFLAMNEIYGGGVFKVSEAEARDPEMMLERTASLEGQFIFDDQIYSTSPGQACVFYLDNQVLGGGWISSTSN